MNAATARPVLRRRRPGDGFTTTPRPAGPRSAARLFRNLWMAAIVSNVGGWMQDTAGAWLMTALTTSPLLIALMQTAASLPALFLAYPAGAAADIFDRRRLLLFWQSWMLASVAILAALTLAGIVSPATLLALTFLLNIGSALNNPAWQAIVPELVPRPELPDAIAMNSAGFNLARAAGPALGGLAVAAFATAARGAGVVFSLNAVSFLAVIAVLAAWQRTPPFKSALPAERLFGSMRSGARYLRHSPALQAVFLRAFVFTTFASAMWALLAVVARQDLHHGAMAYGILNGCLGVGAVLGAFTLPKLRRRCSGRLHHRRRGSGIRLLAIGSGAVADHGADRLLVAGGRLRLDQHHFHLQRRRATLGSGLGAGARAGRVSDRILGRHGAGQRALGIHRRARLHIEIAARRRGRNAAHAALRHALPPAARGAARSQPVPAQPPGPAGSDRAGP